VTDPEIESPTFVDFEDQGDSTSSFTLLWGFSWSNIWRLHHWVQIKLKSVQSSSFVPCVHQNHLFKAYLTKIELLPPPMKNLN